MDEFQTMNEFLASLWKPGPSVLWLDGVADEVLAMPAARSAPQGAEPLRVSGKARCRYRKERVVMTREEFNARFPRWEYLAFDYGRWTATHENYDASWEGEEDGYVDNGMKCEGRTIEELAEEVEALEAEMAEMTVEQALFSILGDETGHAIIADMGVHWGVVTAMAAATTADDPEALAAIRRWNAEQAEAARALYQLKAGEVADLLASADTHPKGGDVEQAPSLMSGAVPHEDEADAHD